ncbi:MAG: site-specific integrase [Ferruginibacter sp.]|nr:site-specific integrase [Ferruginibacter sp.]
MGTIRFNIRKDKPNKDSLLPVEIIYQLHSERATFRTSIKILDANWCQKTQSAIFIEKKKVLGSAPKTNPYFILDKKEVDDINDSLNAYRKEIRDIEKGYELSGIVYNCKTIIEKLKSAHKPKSKRSEPVNSITDFIKKYISDHELIRERSSLKIYRTLQNHITGFQDKKKCSVTFSNIDYSFFSAFQNYLVAQGLNNNSVAKNLSTLKTFLNYAKIHGFEVSENYRDFKIKKESHDVIALTQSELEQVLNAEVKSTSMSQIRDVFCFSCFTGLRFSDIKNLKRENIKVDSIRITVKKTKEQLMVPLTPFSMSILNRYKNYPAPLPVISNQKSNRAIKEICKMAGIDEPVEVVKFYGAKRESNVYPKYELITMHTGRKTFCTLSLERGMNAEEVMKISGHRSYASFSRYVKITEQRSKVVMSKAWGELKSILKAI